MSHVIGKVYDVNKENMNKLIAELDEAQAKLKIAAEALENIVKYDKTYCLKDDSIMSEHCSVCVAEQALSGIKTHDTSDIVPDRE